MQLPTDGSLAMSRALSSTTNYPHRTLPDSVDPACVIDALLEPKCANIAIAGLKCLRDCQDPVFADAAIGLTRTRWPTVKCAVFDMAREQRWLDTNSCLSEDQRRELRTELATALRRDSSWSVRKAAVHALDLASADLQTLWIAANDPHWRVRNALIDAITARQLSDEQLDAIHPGDELDARQAGIIEYLKFVNRTDRAWPGLDDREAPDRDQPASSATATGTALATTAGSLQSPEIARLSTESLPPDLCDPDPMVVARELECLTVEQQQDAVRFIPALMWHQDVAVRSAAARILQRFGQADELAEIILVREDPRNFGCESVCDVLNGLGDARRAATATRILEDDDPSPTQLAWALDQIRRVVPVEPWRQLLAGLWHQPSQDEIFVAELRLAGFPDVFDATQAARLIRLAAGTDSEIFQQLAVSVLGQRLNADRSKFAQDAAHSTEPQAPASGQHVEVSNQRHPAANSVGSQNETNPEFPRLNSFLTSPFARVRATAIRLLDEFEAVGLADLRQLARDPSYIVRTTVARIAARESADGGLSDPGVNEYLNPLQHDDHPFVRAAALTRKTARRLAADPTQESSIHVVKTAATMVHERIEQPSPPIIKPSPATACTFSGFESIDSQTCPHVAFGPDRIPVSRLGLSGHYRLPEAGFAAARDCGINLMFWEPDYDTMTRFMRSQMPQQRRDIHLIAGSFAATGKGVRRDVERTLRSLQVEQISLFQIFWTRSWNRINEDVRQTLEELQQAGTIRMFSLSTHNRTLAFAAIEQGWNPLMVRHSLAHRGAETQIFPRAIEAGTSMITFNNTCYGRLLKPVGDSVPPTAAECYWYSLAQPAVTCCLTAPSTIEQLQHNLSSLQMSLDESATARRFVDLKRHGDRVYARDRRFTQTVRSR